MNTKSKLLALSSLFLYLATFQLHLIFENVGSASGLTLLTIAYLMMFSAIFRLYCQRIVKGSLLIIYGVAVSILMSDYSVQEYLGVNNNQMKMFNDFALLMAAGAGGSIIGSDLDRFQKQRTPAEQTVIDKTEKIEELNSKVEQLLSISKLNLFGLILAISLFIAIILFR